jgi:CMP-N,N'-diacetyllegionaminic acid synthase
MKPYISALLTGRSGSSLADKNILPVLGAPLLAYSARAAKQSSYIHSFYCSSDCSKILTAASAEGYQPIQRPPELALPTTQHVDVLYHALNVMEAKSPIDIMVVQLANVATIKAAWIDACISMLLEDESLSSVVPVHQNQDNHPMRAKRLSNDGLLCSFFDIRGTRVSSNRQDLEPCFYLDHSIWVLRVNKTLKGHITGEPPWNFLGDRVKPFITEGSFDVHSREDIELTSKWLVDNHIVTP